MHFVLEVKLKRNFTKKINQMKNCPYFNSNRLPITIQKKTILIVVLNLISISTFSQSISLEDFQKQIAASGLQFEIPANYKSTDVKENPDLQYSFAIVNSAGTMQIRYSIFPLEQSLIDFEKSKSDPNITMANPNKIHIGLVVSNGINMTGGKIVDVRNFTDDAVKKEFNANSGGFGFFQFNCEFGKGYKYGQFIYLHKENIANVIITFMSNDIYIHAAEMQKAFYALTFK